MTNAFCSEVTPREPVDDAVHGVDIATGKYEVIKGEGDLPEARVGHTASVVNGEILVFAGVSFPPEPPC